MNAGIWEAKSKIVRKKGNLDKGHVSSCTRAEHNTLVSLARRLTMDLNVQILERGHWGATGMKTQYMWRSTVSVCFTGASVCGVVLTFGMCKSTRLFDAVFPHDVQGNRIIQTCELPQCSSQPLCAPLGSAASSEITLDPKTGFGQLALQEQTGGNCYRTKEKHIDILKFPKTADIHVGFFLFAMYNRWIFIY